MRALADTEWTQRQRANTPTNTKAKVAAKYHATSPVGLVPPYFSFVLFFCTKWGRGRMRGQDATASANVTAWQKNSSFCLCNLARLELEAGPELRCPALRPPAPTSHAGHVGAFALVDQLVGLLSCSRQNLAYAGHPPAMLHLFFLADTWRGRGQALGLDVKTLASATSECQHLQQW